MSRSLKCPDQIYQGSNGTFYTEWQVDQKLQNGAWAPCLYENATGRRLVGVADELLLLCPTDPTRLPPWLEIRSDGHAVTVVDTRRVVP